MGPTLKVLHQGLLVEPFLIAKRHSELEGQSTSLPTQPIHGAATTESGKHQGTKSRQTRSMRSGRATHITLSGSSK